MVVIIQSIIVGVQVGVSVRIQEHVRQVVSMATLTGNLYFSPATCYARFDHPMIACQDVWGLSQEIKSSKVMTTDWYKM